MSGQDTTSALLREQLAVAERRADAAEARAERAEQGRERDAALIAALEADLSAAQSQAAEQRIAAEQAHAQAQEYAQAADDLRRADVTRRTAGLWHRLRAVWRGE